MPNRPDVRAGKQIALTLLCFSLILRATISCLAQTTSGSVIGTVRDKAGNGIPQALIRLVNEENSIPRATRTDDAGRYSMADLAPGKYRVVASKQGFLPQTVSGFPVQLNQKNVVRLPQITLSQVTVRGYVIDRTDKALINAVVIISDDADGDTYQTTTDAAGSYSVSDIAPGNYNITASWDGENGESNASIPIALDKENVYAPHIKLADAVSASQALVPQAGGQAEDGEKVAAIVRAIDVARTTNFTDKQIDLLPLGGASYIRTFDDLASLVAGVAPPPYTPGARGPGIGFGVGTAGQFSVNGMRARSNNFSVDGSDNNDPDVGVRRQGFVALVPQSLDTVKELSISTLLWDAELGRNFGSQVNAVSKYGSNNYHGRAYVYFTDSRLNARNFFDGSGAVAGGKDPFTRTQMGFVIGGPIVRERTQFFAGVEQEKTNASTEQHFSSPTLAERSFLNTLARFLEAPPGMFSVQHPVINRNPNILFNSCPNPLAPPCANGGTTPLGRKILSFYPLPNDPSGPYGENTYTQILPAEGKAAIASFKLTHQFTPSNSLNGRYNFTDDLRVLPSVGNAINSTINADTRTQNLSLIFDSSLSATLFSQARFSYGRTRLKFPPYANSPFEFHSETTESIGGELFSSQTGPIGELAIEPFSHVGIDDYTFPQGRVNNAFQFSDTITSILNGHTIRLGADVRRYQFNSFQDRLYRPLVTYGNGVLAPGNFFLTGPGDTPPGKFRQDGEMVVLPGVALATLGMPSSVFQTITAGTPNSRIGLRFTEYNYFVNDNWRILPNLTIDYGLRYEYNSVPAEANNIIESALKLDNIPSSSTSRINTRERAKAFNAALDAYRRVLDGRKRIYDPDRNNFGLHTGFAFDPWSDGRTAIRAGYGIYYDTILGAVVSQSRNVFPNELPINTSVAFDVFNLANNAAFIQTGNPPIHLIRPGTGNQFGGAPQDYAPLIGQLLLQNLSGGGFAFTLPAKSLRTPYAQQMHLTIEREVFGGCMISAAYVRAKGSKLTRLTTPNLGPNATTTVPVAFAIKSGPVTIPLPAPIVVPDSSANLARPRPDSALGSYQIFENSASSSYDALQLEARNKPGQSYQFTVAYAWSHAIDDVSDVFPIAGAPIIAQDSFNLRLERGNANFDVRHRFAASLIIDLPFYKNSGKGLGRLLGGWQIASIFQAHTGQPFTLNVPVDANLDGNLTDRPSTTNGLIFFEGRGPRRLSVSPGSKNSDFFAFGQNGNVGRNTVRGHGFMNLDATFNKTFRITEMGNLLFRADLFNILNRANFGLPIRIIGAPGFGSAVETANPARTIQFALKYAF